MKRAERPRALEAICMSRDPSLHAADRLRALELLDRLGDEPETAGEAISAEVSAMSTSALDAELDALLAGLIRDGEIARFPETAAALMAQG